MDKSFYWINFVVKDNDMYRNIYKKNSLTCLLACLILSILTVSCKRNASTGEAAASLTPDVLAEDTAAMHRLRGIWVNQENDNVVFKVEGDSIFYPDETILPVSFSIVGDSLLLNGEQVRKYKITKQGDYVFDFVSPSGEEVRLRKSDNAEDSLAFCIVHIKPVIYTEVTKRDTVVMQGGERYHCYVFVNPSRNKVYKTSYNDEGMKVENFYYDNVIHLSVFHGNKRVFSRDFTKKDFREMVPETFLEHATLSDVTFSHVDENGFHFDAKICVPDDAKCYMAEVLVDKDGKHNLMLMDY